MKYFLTFSLLATQLFLVSCTKSTEDGNIINGVLEQKVKSLDPIQASDSYSNRIVSQIYEGLYNYHYLKRPLEIQPVLAEGLPQISEDGLTYTIKIKKNIQFADDSAFTGGKGRKVTAQDFIYSWKRLADPANKAAGWWIFNGRIKGLNEWQDKMARGQASYDTAIAGLQTPDDHTLVINLTKPFYQFSHLLTMPFTFVVPREAVEVYGIDFVSKPVGTGPYKLKQWVRGSMVRLIRNDDYHEMYYPSEGADGDKEKGLLADAGKRLPLTDHVEIKIMVERQPIWLNFLKGNLDHTLVPTDSFDQAYSNNQLKEELVNKGIKNDIFTRADVIYTGFNMENPLFSKNKKLRQAMILAFDTAEEIKKFQNGRAIIANGPIPPNIDGFDADYKSSMAYNLEQAKKMLAEAGYPEGKGLPVLEFDMASTATIARQNDEFFKDQMAKLGIQIRLIPNSWPQFDKKVKSKQSVLFSQAWAADYPDGENFLQMFYSKNVSPGSNAMNFRSREFDALYEKAVSMSPGPERTQLYREMNKYIAEECPGHMRFHRIAFRPYHGWLKNYKNHDIIQDFYKYLRVDAKEKNKLKKKL